MNDAATIKAAPEKTALALEHKHERPLTACHWNPKSRFIFFGAEDNLVHRFDLTNRTAISLAAHDSWVRSFASSPDGATLYSGGYDGRLGFWPATDEKPQPIRMVTAHEGWLRAIAVSHDGKHVATCGNDRLVRLWDAKDGTAVKEFKGHTSHVYNIAFTQDGSSIVSCDHKGMVIAWSVATGEKRDVASVDALHEYDTTFRADIGGARGIAVHRNGAQVALGGITNVTNAFAGVGEVAIALVNLADGKVERVLQSKGKKKGCIWGVAHHEDGFWIGLSGGGGGWLMFWKGDTDHEFHSLQLKNDGRGMSLSPDRTQLAVAHGDNHLRTYTLYEKA